MKKHTPRETTSQGMLARLYLRQVFTSEVSSPAPRPLGATERCAQNTLWSAPGEATILFPISPSARVLSPTTHPTPTLQKLSQSIARPLPLMARPELMAALRGQHCSLQCASEGPGGPVTVWSLPSQELREGGVQDREVWMPRQTVQDPAGAIDCAGSKALLAF